MASTSMQRLSLMQLRSPDSSTLSAINGNKKVSASEKRRLRAKAKKLADRAGRQAFCILQQPTSRLADRICSRSKKNYWQSIDRSCKRILVSIAFPSYSPSASCREIRLAKQAAGITVGSPKKVSLTYNSIPSFNLCRMLSP